jgi:hypothetical protein
MKIGDRVCYNSNETDTGTVESVYDQYRWWVRWDSDNSLMYAETGVLVLIEDNQEIE